jgi:outer membrane protein TolC
MPENGSLAEATQMALSSRQELKQLKAYQELNSRQTALYRGSGMPGLFGVVDYGIQGEDYSFTEDDDFVMASLVFQWTLFKGRTNHQKVQRSQIEGDKIQSMYKQTEQQISLEVINRYYALQAALEAERSARAQLNSARRAYTLVQRKYQEGQASLLELIDARTGLTSASSDVIIARTDYYIGLADLEYATGQSLIK